MVLAAENGVALLYQNPDGSLATAYHASVHQRQTDALAVRIADLDGDGRLDVVAADSGADFQGFEVYRQQLDGTLGAPVQYAVPRTNAASTGRGIDTGNPNGDGRDDVAVNSAVPAETSGRFTLRVAVFHQAPAGEPGAPVFTEFGESTVGNGPLRVGDVTGDGLADAVVSRWVGPLVPQSRIVVLAQGGGTLALAGTYDMVINPPAIALADMDGDGSTGAVASRDSVGLDVFLQTEAGALGLASSHAQYPPAGTGIDALAALNVEQDRFDAVAIVGGRPTVTLGAGTVAVPVREVAWQDLDADGIRDPGEPPLGGARVTVRLISNPPPGGVAVTAEDGTYELRLTPDAYHDIRDSAPPGYALTTANAGADDAVDSDFVPIPSSPDIGFGPDFDLNAGPAPTLDAGFVVENVTLVGKTLRDTNRDGLGAGGEPGVGGVLVEPLSGAAVIAQTVSEFDGDFAFSPLPGTYRLRFTPPSECAFTVQDVTGEDPEFAGRFDIGADPATGLTAPFVLAPGATGRDVEAGFVHVVAEIDRFLPLDPQGTWRYRFNGTGQVDWTAGAEPSTLPNGDSAQPLVTTLRDVWLRTSGGTGLRLHGTDVWDPGVSAVDGFTYRPAINFARPKRLVGDTVTQSGTVLAQFGGLGFTANFDLAYQATSAFEAVEVVSVPAGDFTAAKYVIGLRLTGFLFDQVLDASGTIALWLARDVGIVKLVDSDGLSADVYALLEEVPEVLAPQPGVRLGRSDADFQWLDRSGQAGGWRRTLGASPGAADVYDSGALGAETAVTVPALPEDGGTVHARLSDPLPGGARTLDFTCTAAQPRIASPAAGTTLPGTSATFQWPGVYRAGTQFWLSVGSTPGASDLLDSGNLGATSATVAGLPGDGSAVQAQFWYQPPGSARWQSVTGSHTAATLPPPALPFRLAALARPLPAQALLPGVGEDDGPIALLVARIEQIPLAVIRAPVPTVPPQIQAVDLLGGAAELQHDPGARAPGPRRPSRAR